MKNSRMKCAVMSSLISAIMLMSSCLAQTISDKIPKYENAIPSEAIQVASGYGWRVYLEETEETDYCRIKICRLFLENAISAWQKLRDRVAVLCIFRACFFAFYLFFFGKFVLLDILQQNSAAIIYGVVFFPSLSVFVGQFYILSVFGILGHDLSIVAIVYYLFCNFFDFAEIAGKHLLQNVPFDYGWYLWR